MYLIPNQKLHVVVLCKSGKNLLLVHPNPLDEIIRHSNVQCAVSPARENVNEETHCTWPWTPAFAGVNGVSCTTRRPLTDTASRSAPLRPARPSSPARRSWCRSAPPGCRH